MVHLSECMPLCIVPIAWLYKAVNVTQVIRYNFRIRRILETFFRLCFLQRYFLVSGSLLGLLDKCGKLRRGGLAQQLVTSYSIWGTLSVRECLFFLFYVSETIKRHIPLQYCLGWYSAVLDDFFLSSKLIQ